jgi:hypothetical protein
MVVVVVATMVVVVVVVVMAMVVVVVMAMVVNLAPCVAGKRGKWLPFVNFAPHALIADCLGF